jgi:hypothetical protein
LTTRTVASRRARLCAIGVGVALIASTLPAAAAEPDSAAAAASSAGWRYSVSPYIWVATISGDFGADGAQGSTESDYSFWALENLQGYWAVHFDARASKWGWFADALHVAYGDEFTRPNLTTSLGVAGEIYEVGGLYGLRDDFGFAVLAGLRRVDLTVSVGLTPGPDGDSRASFTDPYAGVEWSHPLAEHWYVEARGDYGSGSARSQVQGVAKFGYRFSDRLEVFGGYRYLKVHFEDDQALLNLTAAGPGFGFSWSW